MVTRDFDNLGSFVKIRQADIAMLNVGTAHCSTFLTRCVLAASTARPFMFVSYHVALVANDARRVFFNTIPAFLAVVFEPFAGGRIDVSPVGIVDADAGKTFEVFVLDVDGPWVTIEKRVHDEGEPCDAEPYIFAQIEIF